MSIKCPHCGKRIKEKDFNMQDSSKNNKKGDDMAKRKKVDCRTKKGRETLTCKRKRKERKTLSKKPAKRKSKTLRDYVLGR